MKRNSLSLEENMKILFLGDSITDAKRERSFEGHLYGLGYGYVNQVAASLMQEDAFGFEFVNRGIGGNRVVDLYARVKSDVWYEHPDLLSILVGVNDACHDFHEIPNGVEVDRFEKVYRMLLEDTKKALPKAKLILCEPFILCGEYSVGVIGKEKLQAVKRNAAVAKKLAEEFSIPFVSLQEKFDLAAKKYGAERLLPDGVHPNSLGASLIAKEWLSVFKKEIL